MTGGHDIPLNRDNLDMPAEPLSRKRQANPLPIWIGAFGFFIMLGTCVVAITLVNMNRTAQNAHDIRMPQPGATATPVIGGTSDLGAAIENATPRPSQSGALTAPIGKNDSATIGSSTSTAPAPQATTRDLNAEIARAEALSHENVTVPPLHETLQTAAPAYVPAPSGTPPDVSIGRRPTSDTGDDTTTMTTQATVQHDPTALVSGGAQMRAPDAPATSAPSGSGITSLTPAETLANKKLAFNSAAGAAPGYLNSRVHDPISEDEIFASTPIRAQLDDTIVTSIPGDCWAHVTDPVLGSLPPYRELIPRGTKLQCRYNGAINSGDTRVQFAFDVMKFADGRSFDFSGMPGADTSGAAGLNASSIDDHRNKIFTTTLLSAIIEGGLAASQPTGSLLTGSNPGSQLAGTVGSSVAQTAQQLISQQVQRPPTITIDKGRQFIIRLRSTIVIDPPDTETETARS